MQWGAFLLALVKAVSALFTWAQSKRLIDAGEAKALAAQLRAQADVIAKAQKARDDARTLVRSHPERLPDDGFRRD